ncbi:MULTISPECIES: LysR family transcriptional regulator [Edwardsiella]|uniref:HTH lysR-type domain-containing protein n=2 Tax=Edwardsiella anguillarum TaxID=1821960 RepID=A0A076LKY3_9GAMM|nr:MULTISPECIES: LysR family transcriptional regulator [Edwardsiella]AIJ09100.1 Hypothetical protein ETEE_2666 [Edwardsiella anguillarum ET080813]AKR77049.1 LysR family transcriptional regulator [Edwardsiella sp. LADL05-105]KAB0587224.1 LysR family transcriptional regulator [Edwardsiella anguillarum]UOU80285.1 LysR family transcriptional regulator [Edwardsiella anguillarum]WHP81053.1 LysR family transcriptional regulator [Edwardsiella anguillarum]
MHLHKLIAQFRVLVEKKTFIAAAENLFISQPTLTQNMQRLESALDVSLLVRNGKKISLTVYGDSLYQHACLLERNYRQAMLDIDTIKRSHRETLVLECGHAWSHGVLFKLMQRYMAQFPDVRIVIKNSNSAMGQQHLLKGECDLALGAIPAPDNRLSAIHYIPIFTTRFMLFCAPDHPLATSRHISQKRLSQSEWVVLRHESEEGEFEDPLLCSIPPERVRFEVFSVSNAIALVSQSHCILPLPLQLEQEATNRGLVPLDMAKAFSTFQTGIMYIDDVLKHGHKRAFIDTIIESKSHFGDDVS